jgi:hypothetical protein
LNIREANLASRTGALMLARRYVSYAGVTLIDVRQDFPSYQVGRTMGPRDPAQLMMVTQHHDAAYYAQDPLPGDDAPAELARIAAVYRQHTAQGWGGIGYHTYGFPSGRLYLVGSFETQRANVAGRNHLSIGHCSAGLFMGSMPPLGTQLVAAMATIAAWKYAGRLLAPLSHRDAALRSDPTACPGDTQDLWVPSLPRMIQAIAPQLRAA